MSWGRREERQRRHTTVGVSVGIGGIRIGQGGAERIINIILRKEIQIKIQAVIHIQRSLWKSDLRDEAIEECIIQEFIILKGMHTWCIGLFVIGFTENMIAMIWTAAIATTIAAAIATATVARGLWRECSQ